MSTAQTRRQQKLQYPTRPVENDVLTTKGLQERKTTTEWNDVGKIGNKNELILTTHTYLDNNHLIFKHCIEVDGFFQDVKILSTSPPGGTLSWGSQV